VAGINYLMNRVHTCPITNEEKTKELNIIQDTLYNNEYNNKNLNIRHPIKKKKNKITGKKQNKSQKFSKKQILKSHSKQRTPYKT
jgi:hypothetical protein